MLETLIRIGLVAIGSAFGGVLRWGVGIGAAKLVGTAFPFGTFFINVTGSFILGWIYAKLDHWAAPWSWLDAGNTRLLIAVGFCGGFTTFSTFEWESFDLIRNGLSLPATIYVAGSVVVGLIALQIGFVLGGR